MSTFVVAPCPLCTWHTDPLRSLEHAREARRAHINTHTHTELVEYVTLLALERIDHYDARDGGGQ